MTCFAHVTQPELDYNFNRLQKRIAIIIFIIIIQRLSFAVDLPKLAKIGINLGIGEVFFIHKIGRKKAE